jgi:hypothetical protein
MRDPMHILRNLANSPWHDNDTIRDALLTGKEFTYEEVTAVARKSVEIWLRKKSNESCTRTETAGHVRETLAQDY